MIDVGKLYCGGTSTGDGLRYGTKAKKSTRPPWRHYAMLSALVISVSGIIVVAEWYLLFVKRHEEGPHIPISDSWLRLVQHHEGIDSR